jgi:hypothetical protein
VLSSALSALTERADSKFLTAYWLPAFVAVLGWLGMLAALAGPGPFVDWVKDLDSVELELPPFGGHSIIGHAMPMRRCSHAPHQAGLSP